MAIKKSLENIILVVGITGTVYRFGKAFGDAWEAGREIGGAYAFLDEAKREISMWKTLDRLSSEGKVDEFKQTLQNTKISAKNTLLHSIELYEAGKTSLMDIQKKVHYLHFTCNYAYGQQLPQWLEILKKYEEKSLPCVVAQTLIHSIIYGSKRFND